jgi:hypothetical protein
LLKLPAGLSAQNDGIVEARLAGNVSVRIYNRFILWLAFVFALTTVLLSTTSQGLDTYFSVYLAECLAAMLLFSHLSPRARRGLNHVGYVLVFGFLLLVSLKVAEIVSGVEL